MDADYKGFGEHYLEYVTQGIPIGINDLKRLAKKYNTPIPELIGGDLVFKV